MSKNKRLIRGFFAGFVFVACGIVGSMYADRYDDNSRVGSTVVRGPASTASACGLCDELKRIKSVMATRPASASDTRPAAKSENESLDALQFQSRAKLALAESFDGIALRKAGALVSDLLRMREPGEDELRSITLFFVTTAPRDGAGIVLDMISETLSPEKTDRFLNSVDAELASLVFEKVLTIKQSDGLKASFAAFRDQSTSGQD
jgi:hypothetical protein